MFQFSCLFQHFNRRGNTIQSARFARKLIFITIIFQLIFLKNGAQKPQEIQTCNRKMSFCKKHTIDPKLINLCDNKFIFSFDGSCIGIPKAQDSISIKTRTMLTIIEKIFIFTCTYRLQLFHYDIIGIRVSLIQEMYVHFDVIQ